MLFDYALYNCQPQPGAFDFVGGGASLKWQKDFFEKRLRNAHAVIFDPKNMIRRLLFPADFDQRLSSSNVTGPSLVSETSMCWRNFPVATRMPCPAAAAANVS